MSTRNLRELIEIAEEAWPERPINAVARKELEAIEKAAKLYCKRGKTMEEATEVDRALVSIAEGTRAPGARGVAPGRAECED